MVNGDKTLPRIGQHNVIIKLLRTQDKKSFRRFSDVYVIISGLIPADDGRLKRIPGNIYFIFRSKELHMRSKLRSRCLLKINADVTTLYT